MNDEKINQKFFFQILKSVIDLSSCKDSKFLTTFSLLINKNYYYLSNGNFQIKRKITDFSKF